MPGNKKSRSISKGLLKRITLYIRDHSVDGRCERTNEEIAQDLGLAPETVLQAVQHLAAEKVIMTPVVGARATDLSTYIYLGEGELPNLLADLLACKARLTAALPAAGPAREAYTLYDGKVQELINLAQQYSQDVQEYDSFRDSVIKSVESLDGLHHIIARKPVKKN